MRTELLPDEQKKLKSVYVHFVMMKRLISYLRQEVQGFLCVIVLLRLQWQLHIGMFRGSAEAMRAASAEVTPRAMLSRAVSAIRNHTLIVNLPGSPKAVKENLEAVLPVVEHGLEILTGQAGECGR